MRISLFAGFLTPVWLFSLPQGFVTIAGVAEAAVAGENLTIQSHGRTIIHWDDFSIHLHESVMFDQAGTHAAVLNRVLGVKPSDLLGNLQSNGPVYLINPHGVLIGPDARIVTNGFLAATADVLDSDFLSMGDMLFVHASEGGTITHQGTIHCPSGDIFLLAKTIVNEGTLSAPLGDVGIGAGQEILLRPPGGERLFIQPANTQTSLTHTGVIEALSAELKMQGSPYALAVGTSPDALSAVQVEGRTFLTIDGKISANKIHASGDTLFVLDHAELDASSASGGGDILLGGDLRGSNPDIPNAKCTYIADGAQIRANALEEGTGGKVIVWANDRTYHGGHIAVQGMTGGGFVEVSGDSLQFLGTVDLYTDAGPKGTLLLDPHNITVVGGGGAYTPPYTFATTPAVDVTIDNVSLATAINAGAVVLQSNTDTFFNSSVTTAAPVGSLTVQAGRAISIAAAVVLTMNNADFSATINDAGAIIANRDVGPAADDGGAVFSMAAGSSMTSTSGDITITFGAFTAAGIPAGGYVDLNGGTISTVSGDISITGQGYALTSYPASVSSDGVTIRSTSSVTTSGTGTITITGTSGITTQIPSHGINMLGASLVQTSGSGTVAMTGTANSTGPGLPACMAGQPPPNCGPNNAVGVQMASPSIVRTTGSGNLSITGTSLSDSTGWGSNIGILVGNTVQSTSTGTITLTGTGSVNEAVQSSNDGIQVIGGGVITSATGDISLTGIGGGTMASTSNAGVQILQSGQVTSTGVGAAAADITITGSSGPGAANGNVNVGILLQSTLTAVSTIDGDLFFNATGGTATSTGGADVGFRTIDAGSSVATPGVLSTGDGNITITAISLAAGGTNSGINLEDSFITSSGTGAITMTGTGSVNGTGIRNNGIQSVNSRVQTNAGNMTLLGHAGGVAGSSLNDGLLINGGTPSSIWETIGTGSISITGDGSNCVSTAANNNGIQIGCIIRSTSAAAGAGTITIVGTGITTGSTGTDGIDVSGGGNISSVTGAISLTGTGGGQTSDNHGVHLDYNGFGSVPIITSSGSAPITIIGTGGGAMGVATTNNNGIMIEDINAGTPVTVSSTGTGSITMTGTGSAFGTSQNQGIRVTDSGFVTSVAGTMNLTGTGGGNGTGTNNVGIDVDLSGDIIATGTASMNVIGFGGNGTTTNHGIQIDGSGSAISSSSTGLASLTGAGSISAGATSQNNGVLISNQGAASASSGTLSIAGTGGGNGTGTNNSGVRVDSDGDISITGTAALNVTGTGGNGTTDNNGIEVTGLGSSINSTSIQTMTLAGVGSTAAAATSNNHGISINTLGFISSVDGAVNATGTGGGFGGGSSNVGVLIDTLGQITMNGAGALNLMGTGGNGTSADYGIELTGGGGVTGNSSGSLLLTGTPGAATQEAVLASGGFVSTTASAPMTVASSSGDILITAGGTFNASSTGTITVNAADNLRLEGGGGSAVISPRFGDVTVTAGIDVILLSGMAVGDFAQIGFLSGAINDATANINVHAAGNVTVTAQDSDSYAVIGHGEPTSIFPGLLSGNITVNATNVAVQGANSDPAGVQGFAQIGHLDQPFSAFGPATLDGNITINATSDITITGGSATVDSYARVGHGGVPPVGSLPTVSGNILMIADSNISMITPVGGASAQIVNLSMVSGSDAITLVVDDAFPIPFAYGAGQFNISAGSLLSANPGAEVRIYTVMPAQNSINELLNGMAFIAGPLYVNTAQETWSTYYPAGAYGGLPFNIYYKIPIPIAPVIIAVINQLEVQNAQLPILLPTTYKIFGPFLYDDYPYHGMICIRDFMRGRKGSYREQCEPKFLRFRSMMFENFAR